eukprot:c26781_g1_i2 orf=55-372(+)
MRTVLVWDFRHVEMLDIYMQIHLLLDNHIYLLEQHVNGAIVGLLLTMEAHSLVGPVNAPDILKAVRDNILNVGPVVTWVLLMEMASDIGTYEEIFYKYACLPLSL